MLLYFVKLFFEHKYVPDVNYSLYCAVILSSINWTNLLIEWKQ